jgi:endonuclease YncB( thermonuclease family)
VRGKTPGKLISLKKGIIAGATIATLGLGYWASQAFYTVTSVIDGDTFVTAENQYVRFNKIDAPEIDLCLGKEAKAELEKLILNTKVFLKVHFIEKDRNRLISSVYSGKGNIEVIMLAKGLATLRGGSKQEELNNAVGSARNLKLGVYSDTCTQATNPSNPKCNIKGNVRHNEKYYRYPGCDQYETTLVQLHFGDKWFCTESDAIKSGFVKGGDCLK